MDNYEIIQPYQHEVFSARIGHFDIEIDVETGMYGTMWCFVNIKSTIGEVIFYIEEVKSKITYADCYKEYMSEVGIQRIVDLSNERLNEIKQLTKE